MRIGSVYAAHERSLEVFLAQSLPRVHKRLRQANQFRRNPPLRRSDGEEMPFAGHALELVSAAVLELES